VIEPDGNVYTCSGHPDSAKNPSPLVLANVNDEPLDLILTAEHPDPLLQALFMIGHRHPATTERSSGNGGI
jgi:hypothetical protein